MSNLAEVFKSLKSDLLTEEGPRISTMRNYSFAILVYKPEDEFDLRKHTRRLSDHLRGEGWAVLEISLQKLLMKRLKSLPPEVLNSWVETEKRQARKDGDRALNRVKESVANLLEGEDGLARDVVQLIEEFGQKYPDKLEKTLIWIRRMGSLYPFYRCSSLLKHLDGKTQNVPVVLLYPGERRDKTSLSFMAEMPADRDYRPRIYSAEEAS